MTMMSTSDLILKKNMCKRINKEDMFVIFVPSLQ